MSTSLRTAVDDFELALCDALVRLGRPTAPAALARALPKPHKRPVADVTRALDVLVRDGRAFVMKAGRVVAYVHRDPNQVLVGAIRAALADGPATKKQLGDRVKRAAPGFEKGFGAVLAEEIARGVVREHPKVGRLPARVGLAPPDAAPFLAKAVKEIKAAQKKLAKSGVTGSAILAAIAQAIGAEAIEAVGDTGDGRSVLAAIHEIARREPPGSLLAVRAVRGLLSFDKARFDRAMIALANEGVIVLHHHDYPTSLPETEREALVIDAGGVHYVGVALRGAGA